MGTAPVIQAPTDTSSNNTPLSVGSSEPDFGLTYNTVDLEVTQATVNEIEEVKRLCRMVNVKYPDKSLAIYLLNTLNEIDAYHRRVAAVDLSYLNMIIHHGVCDRKYLTSEISLNYSNLLLNLLNSDVTTLKRIIKNRPPVTYQDFLTACEGRNVTLEDDIFTPHITTIRINEPRWCSLEASYILSGLSSSVIKIWERLYPEREYQVVYN